MQPQFITGYAPVNGIDMYYEIHGDNSIPLVLIHGGGSTIETNFAAILPLFAKTQKVIAVELQAHGRTSDRNEPESFKQDAADVAALLKHLKIEKANILGFSHGGCTALQLAIDHPGLIHKMIIISSNYSRAGMVPGFYEGMENVTLADMPQPLKDGFLKVNNDPAKLLNMFNKDKAKSIAFEDFKEEDIKSIKSPALIMAGDKDVILTEEIVKLSQLIPNARLIILPGFHGTLLGEVCSIKPGSKQPEITATLIDEFLNAE
ncbi:alpha/beta fold hydrolase [Mucilaginibacter litoreus]|uniref:Alpha/beta fold hydrolase n=1 Tax=Mucilaginibacter litoreus TaxID=1048221 RepID=A0ABW3ASE6_9SPHI